MKKLFLFCSFFAMASLAQADSHRETLRKFFAAANMEQALSLSLEKMVEIQSQSAPDPAIARKVLLKFFSKYLSWKSLEPDFSQLYSKEFSDPELIEITHFYESPVGKKALQKMPELVAEGAAIGQRRMMSHQSELRDMLAKELPPEGKPGGKKK